MNRFQEVTTGHSIFTNTGGALSKTYNANQKQDNYNYHLCLGTVDVYKDESRIGTFSGSCNGRFSDNYNSGINDRVCCHHGIHFFTDIRGGKIDDMIMAIAIWQCVPNYTLTDNERIELKSEIKKWEKLTPPDVFERLMQRVNCDDNIVPLDIIYNKIQDWTEIFKGSNPDFWAWEGQFREEIY